MGPYKGNERPQINNITALASGAKQERTRSLRKMVSNLLHQASMIQESQDNISRQVHNLDNIFPAIEGQALLTETEDTSIMGGLDALLNKLVSINTIADAHANRLITLADFNEEKADPR